MKRKRKITVLFLLFLTGQATGQDIGLSLSDAIQQGLKNNLGIRNAGIEIQKSQSQMKEQQSGLYPQVEGFSDFYYYYALPKMIVPGEIFGQAGDIPVEFGTRYDWSSGFRATQVLFNQSYFTSLKIARQRTEFKELDLRQKKEELVYQISQVYYLCQATKQQKVHLSGTQKNMLELLRLTKLMRQNGIILKADQDQVLVDQNNLQTEIDNLSQLYEQQVNLLKYLMGVNPNSTIELTDSLMIPAADGKQSMPAWESSIEMRKLNIQLEMTRLSLRKDKQAYLPTISGFSQYYYQGQRDRFDFFDGGSNLFFKVGFVGMSLAIPIFDGFEKRSRIQQEKLSLLQLQNSHSDLLNFLYKEHKNARLQYQNNLAAAIRQAENIRVAEENYKVALLGYQQQITPLSDLLRAQNSLTEARLSYDNALLQLKNAELELMKSRGELLNEMI